MAARSTNTMAEFLQKMLSDIATAKTLPDADLAFLLQLETAILQKLRSPIDAMMGQMSPNGQQGNPSQGSPQGQPGQGPSQMGVVGAMNPNPVATPPPAQRVAGIRSDPGAVNMDELMRSMGGAQG